MKVQNTNPNALTHNVKSYVFSFLFSIATLLTFAQTVHTVDNRLQSGAQFTTIQDAIDAAIAGDIIQVHPSSTAYPNFTINKTLTIIGLGHNLANSGEGTRAVVNTINLSGNAPNILITGFAFAQLISSGCTNCDSAKFINNRITWYLYGASTAGRTDDWIIEGNYFERPDNNLPQITPYAGSNNWQIRNNWIQNFSINNANNTTIITNNIFVYSVSFNNPNVFINCTSPIVANNIIMYTNTSTSVTLSNSTVDFNNCLTYSYSGQTIADLPGTGNFNNQDPLFTNVPTNNVTDFYNNDYSLTGGSPGKDAGTDTTDLGIFGNNFVFDPNGRPDLMPYPISMTINNTVVQPGQNLNVDFSAAIKQ